MPKGGKHAVNPKLVEDAKRPHQKPSKLARMKTNALDDDYIAGIKSYYWSAFFHNILFNISNRRE